MTSGTTGNHLGWLILDGIATRRIKYDPGRCAEHQDHRYAQLWRAGQQRDNDLLMRIMCSWPIVLTNSNDVIVNTTITRCLKGSIVLSQALNTIHAHSVERCY